MLNVWEGCMAAAVAYAEIYKAEPKQILTSLSSEI